MSKKRLLELDIMRGIAFLFVVIQHTIGGFSYRDDISINDFYISKLLYVVARSGVPIFVFLSAVALLYRYDDKLDIKDFYIKKIKYLFLPFAIWSIYRLKCTGTEIDGTVIWRVLSGDAQYHLWYMSMIIRIYLYFPLIYLLNKHLKKQSRNTKIGIFLVLTVCYIIINDINISGIMTNFFFTNPSEQQVRFMNNTPLNYAYYFILGAFVVNDYEKIKQAIINNKYKLLLAYIILQGYEYYIELGGSITDTFKTINNYLPVHAVCMNILILLLIIGCSYVETSFVYLSTILKFISKYSFPAYLIHVSILNDLTFKMAITNQLSCSVKFWYIGVVKSIVICWALSYLPFSKYFLGCKTKLNMSKIRNIASKDLINKWKDILYNCISKA